MTNVFFKAPLKLFLMDPPHPCRFFFLKAPLNYSVRQGYCHILAIGHAERIIRSAQALAIIYRVYNGNTPCGTNNFYSYFSILLLLNFSKGYPLMMKKLSKILACGWSIEANPGLLLAETAQFSEN